jgi:hypothetical protein
VCGGEGEEREKIIFLEKVKVKKYYFNEIRNGLGNLLWYIFV